MSTFGISSRFQLLSPCKGQVTHALLTRPPLSSVFFVPKNSEKRTPFDLHVLGMPPAFVLSQDQTLHKIYLEFLAHSLTCLASFVLSEKLEIVFVRTITIYDSVSIIWFVRFQLFNFQRALLAAVLRQLLYITTPSGLCQHLFSSFFQKFQLVMAAG